MDETINEDAVKSCVWRLFYPWQNFLADAAAQNLNGLGSWAATLLRELRHIISAISLVTLNEFCENCESFISQLSSDDIPKKLPPISDFEKLEGALKILSHRVSKCELPIVFKFPLIDSKTVVNLSSLSARFDERIETASKFEELIFSFKGKENYYDTIGQVISVVRTNNSRTLLRIWDGSFPQSTISTERGNRQLFRYSQENVVETLIDDPSGLLQNIPLHYCLDIDLYGRSLPMAKDLQAGDIVLVANMHLNWRKHDEYVIATLHDGEHEIKFKRGLFNIQPNHLRYCDVLGSLSNELCVANLSGLASMMESFLHDSREAREQAKNSISRARNSSGAIPVSITAINGNARLLEELPADENFRNIGIGETGPISGQTRDETVLPQYVPSTKEQPENTLDKICDSSNYPTFSGAITTSMESTQHTAQNAMRDPSQDSNSTIEMLDDIDEGPVGGQHGGSNKKEDQQSSSTITIEYLQLSIEQLSDMNDSFCDSECRSERDITTLEDHLPLTVEQRVSGEDNDATLPCSQDLVLSMEEACSTSVEVIETAPKKTKRRSSETSSSHNVPAAVDKRFIASRGRSDGTVTYSQDLQLSMDDSTSGETLVSPPKRAKRRSSEAGSIHDTPAATADKYSVASKARSHNWMTRNKACTIA